MTWRLCGYFEGGCIGRWVMLTMIRKAFDSGGASIYGKKKANAWPTYRRDDPKVYEMICHADTIGVFQIESRAQMSHACRV